MAKKETCYLFYCYTREDTHALYDKIYEANPHLSTDGGEPFFKRFVANGSNNLLTEHIADKDHPMILAVTEDKYVGHQGASFGDGKGDYLDFMIEHYGSMYTIEVVYVGEDPSVNIDLEHYKD